FLPFFIKRKAYILYSLFVLSISFVATVIYCNLISKCNCNLDTCLSKYLWQTIFPLIFLSFSSLILRVFEKQKELEASKSKALEMELKFLKSQLNPHILFNNLNTIYSYSLEESEKVPEMILNLSDSLKYVLNESENKWVTLEKDLNYIDNYIDFMTLRSEGVKEVTYRNEVGKNDFKITPLLLISIIENAFKHSSSNDKKPAINITISLDKNELNLVVYNDYEENNSSEYSSGIGLVNLKKRLDLMYINRHTLITETIGNIYHVTLKLSLS
ncbi:MAG: histidine kinase, partial [Flavobacteriaceae bacterium]|nr:histidine kinase [Flavobacteriaceae bacterium]